MISDENTIECPYCKEWQHLDDIGVSKKILHTEFRFLILECEDCNKEFKVGADVEYNWVIEKLEEKPESEDDKIIDVPDQLFFPFYGS